MREQRQIEMRDDIIIVSGKISQEEFDEAIEAFRKADGFSWNDISIFDCRSEEIQPVLQENMIETIEDMKADCGDLVRRKSNLPNGVTKKKNTRKYGPRE